MWRLPVVWSPSEPRLLAQTCLSRLVVQPTCARSSATGQPHSSKVSRTRSGTESPASRSVDPPQRAFRRESCLGFQWQGPARAVRRSQGLRGRRHRDPDRRVLDASDTLQFSDEEGSGYVYTMGKGDPGAHEWYTRMYSEANAESRPNRISGYAFNPAGGLGAGSYFEDTVEDVRVDPCRPVINSVARSAQYPPENSRITGTAGRATPTRRGLQHRPQSRGAPLRIGTATSTVLQGRHRQLAFIQREVSVDVFVPPPRWTVTSCPRADSAEDLGQRGKNAGAVGQRHRDRVCFERTAKAGVVGPPSRAEVEWMQHGHVRLLLCASHSCRRDASPPPELSRGRQARRPHQAPGPGPPDQSTSLRHLRRSMLSIREDVRGGDVRGVVRGPSSLCCANWSTQ